MAKGSRFTGKLAASVVDRIKADLASGLLQEGQFIPSERDLSRELGISRVTVRRGLAQLVASQLLRREASRGYAICGPVRKDEIRVQGGSIVCVHALSEQAFVGSQRHALIWAGARDEAARSGHFIFISSIPEADLTPRRAAELARVAGGVLCDHPGREYVGRLVSAGIPVVQFDYHRRKGMPVDAVVQDDAGGLALAVEHLHGRGHRRIGYLDSSGRYRMNERSLNAEQRLAGFKAASHELGIAGECVIQSVQADTRDPIKDLFDAGITALILPHLDAWPAVQEEMRNRAIGLYSDFGLVVWGVGAGGREDAHWPTFITWSREQMGRESVRRLLIRMRGESADPATILIPCELIDRGTGGRGPASETGERGLPAVGSIEAAVDWQVASL